MSPAVPRLLPELSVTLNGQPCFGDVAAASAALGGYDRATVRVPEADARKCGADQGSVLRIDQRNGRPLWEGRLALSPVFREGLATLEASGHKVAAEKAKGRYMPQTRDLGVWVDATGPPHSYPAANAVPSISNVVSMAVANPTASGVTYTAKIAVWFPGITVQRYAFTYSRFAGSGSFNVVSKTGTGPSGTLTTITTHSGGGTVDQIVSSGGNMLVLEISITVGADAIGGVQVANLRVNGIGTTDTFFTSQVAADVAGKLGWDPSGVQASSINILPFDHVSGPWSDGILSYAAGLDDWQWRVLDDRGKGPYLEYTPWERTWITYRSWADVDDLIPQELFNQVIVTWRDDGGAPHSHSLKASPDPLFASKLTNSYEIVLPDPQASDALAAQVAAITLARVSTPRYRGSVSLVEAIREDRGAGGPLDILPGDLLTVADGDSGSSQTLRIYDADYGDGTGPISLGIEQPIPGLLGRPEIATTPLPDLAIVSTAPAPTISIPETEPEFIADLNTPLPWGAYGSKWARRKWRRRWLR